MFIDTAKIYVEAGTGGNGCISFRREKYVPLGGPDGGDGGRGGSIWGEADPGLSTLLDFKYRRHYKARHGGHGSGANKHGKDAEDITIRFPVGTVIRDAETGQVLADLIRPGQRVLLAKGGRGGRGNARFAGPRHQTPRFAEKGEPGEARWLILELKVLADVGLVGYPNAGKSTLLSRITAARPKIADYPFTTLEPNLGVVNLGEGQSFVVADIPGLIEGAHAGVGLGHDFLRHVERTLLLVHVVDMSGLSGRDPWEDFLKINEELRLYSAELAQKPQIVAANKMDLAEARTNLDRLQENFAQAGVPVIPISAATGEGLDRLLQEVAARLKSLREACRAGEEARKEVEGEHRLYSYQEAEPAGFTISREGEVWVVKGKRLEKLIAMTDLNNPEAVRFLQLRLKKRGVFEALRAAGVQEGDTVRIGEMEFDFVEHYDPDHFPFDQ